MKRIDWDEAHRVQSVELLGPSTAKQYHELFNQVGPFTEQVEAAQTVLEIGPGMGKFLATLDPSRAVAIEVSEVNREILAMHGIEAYAPGDLAKSDLGADLAVCLSVLQHCDNFQVAQLFADLRAALRPGAPLYANGVSVKEGFTMAPEAISVSRTRLDLWKYADSAGFGLAASRVLPVPGMEWLDHYLIRFEKLPVE